MYAYVCVLQIQRCGSRPGHETGSQGRTSKVHSLHDDNVRTVLSFQSVRMHACWSANATWAATEAPGMFSALTPRSKRQLRNSKNSPIYSFYLLFRWRFGGQGRPPPHRKKAIIPPSRTDLSPPSPPRKLRWERWGFLPTFSYPWEIVGSSDIKRRTESFRGRQQTSN